MTDRRQALNVISFRNRPHLNDMIAKIKNKTKLRQSDIIRECLTVHLPKMCKDHNADS